VRFGLRNAIHSEALPKYYPNDMAVHWDAMNQSSKLTSEAVAADLPIGVPRRFSMASLLLSLVLLIIATAFVQDIRGGDVIESALVTLVYLSALRAMAARRRTHVLAIMLIVPALVAKWLDHLRPEVLPPGLFIIIGMLCMAFIIIELLRYILRAPRVDSQVLFAGISGYLMLVILWTAAYIFVWRINPDAFAFNSPGAGNRMDPFTALYFSFGVMGTVGFGDIVPVAKAARLLAVLEATTGLFYVTS